MDGVIGMLEGLTVWHWVGIGIVLLTLEVAVGTFDLLWISVGAFATAIVALIPGVNWQGELIFFAIAAIICVTAGRTVFKGLRRAPASHPNLNDRTANMIGHQGEAATAFTGGTGRVKIGDTVWQAEQVGDRSISEGDQVVVAGADGTTLKVKAV
ncbi:MAG TPA: NfeD family protein [Hyphomonadaceae bacterium]|nr:NfeD family protein [Hyphomonadaceae bacterium]